MTNRLATYNIAVMSPVSPALTPRSRARRRNRDRQKRFRARRALESQLATVNPPDLDMFDLFPFGGGDDNDAEEDRVDEEAEDVRPVDGNNNDNEEINQERQQEDLPPLPPQALVLPPDGQPEAGQQVVIIGEEPPDDPPDPVPVEQAEIKDGTWLARELTKVMCFGDISSTSMEKITRLFMDNIDDIAAIQRRGEVTSSYRHTIRKRLNIWQPGFLSAIKYVDLADPEGDPVYLGNLKAIPKKYLNPTLNNNYKLLRTEAYTTLSDIKKHYAATHPFITGEALKTAYKTAALGIDGVREGKSGSRTLYVVSIMFSGCAFLWHIYHPYKGCLGAKPTLEEVLRYVMSPYWPVIHLKFTASLTLGR